MAPVFMVFAVAATFIVEQKPECQGQGVASLNGSVQENLGSDQPVGYYCRDGASG